MRRFWLSAMLAVAAATPGAAQITYTTSGTNTVAQNYGVITFSDPSPQIDAEAFANYGTFTVSGQTEFTVTDPNLPYPARAWDPAFTFLPYDFTHVQYYTNTGTMEGISGFRFDTVTDTGQRVPAQSIQNEPGATITASTVFVGQPTYLLLSGTAIANHGLLSTTADGRIQISGHDVDLSRGGVEIQAFNPSAGGGCFLGGGGFDTPSNYFPEPGIVELLWGVSTNTNYNVTAIFSTNRDGTVAISSPLFTLPQAHAFVYTNQMTPTNRLVEAVFVEDFDTNLSSRAHFDRPNAGATAKTATVEMSTTAIDPFTGQPVRNAAYVLDSILSPPIVTNLVLLTNATVFPAALAPQRPSALKVTRFTPCEFVNGDRPNSVLTTDLFFGPPITTGITNLINTNPPPNFDPTNIMNIVQTNIAFASPIVTNNNAEYVAELTETASTTPGLSFTNQPGRVDIDADNLNLTQAKIRGESLISIRTRNLVANTNSVIDVQNLNYDLGATNGLLVIKNLAPSTVRVFNGNVWTWTAAWTNYLNITNSTLTPDTNVPPNWTTNMTTSTMEVDYMILLVADDLRAVAPVIVDDFAMHSTNVIFKDQMTVNGSLNVDSTSFTVSTNAGLFLRGTTVNWDATDFPNLRYLTNQGTISIPGLANFGSATRPYAGFVNDGSCSAYSLKVWADQLLDDGLLSANGRMEVNANAAKLDGGSFSAVGGDLFLNAGYVKLRNFRITARTLTLAVTNSLADDGAGASNVFYCPLGASLLLKPAQGDLFGTTLNTVLPAAGSAQFVWSAQDRGAANAGFLDNVVIGKLLLAADTNSLVSFSGVGSSNALYVDYLDLEGSMTNDLNTVLDINNNLVIYFADSNLGGDFFLNHTNLAGGRLRWVSSFAGPNSSVPVALASGQVVMMNRSLRYSKTIDSDGDGIPNYYDPTPLDVADAATLTPLALTLVLSNQPPTAAFLSWIGFTGTVYQVEYSTNLAPANWQLLGTFTNRVGANGVATVPDILNPGDTARFYRVKRLQ